MELSPEDKATLKKAALAAAALVIGGKVVKYVRNHGELTGYVYRLDQSRSAILGLFKNGGDPDGEVGGELVIKDGEAIDFIPDEQDIPPETVRRLAETFDPANIDSE